MEDYSWRKDGVVIQMGHRFSRFAGGSLKIKPTQFQDQGLYECTVKNSKGNNTLYVYLTVLGEYRDKRTTIFLTALLYKDKPFWNSEDCHFSANGLLVFNVAFSFAKETHIR